MKKREMSDRAELLSLLPSVDALLRSPFARQIQSAGAKYLTKAARNIVENLRRELSDKKNQAESNDFSRENLLAEAEKRLENVWKSKQNSGLQKVINATGVIIHTNLGRAPLSERARQAVIEAAGYCNLEYDLASGKRGRRGERAEELLTEITGAESALIVNNCAAAAFLVLTVLAKGGEAIVSRGELVEIGGDFRVPDVMEQSGAILREVGTTNRTKLADYENAINENTRIICKIHPSNFRIVGFTKSVGVADLANLAHRKNVLLYEDAGSGAIFDLAEYGLTDEPVITKSVAAGADVITFSGDKLLGGAQSGLIVGRREIVERIRKHPLYRALRVDKLIYAALEATLEDFRCENFAQAIPVLQMLSMTENELLKRAAMFAEKLRESSGENSALKFEIIKGNSVIGGGSAPNVQPATTLLAFNHDDFPVSQLEEKLRGSNPPVITRILEDKVLIDLRTVSESEALNLLEIFEKLK